MKWVSHVVLTGTIAYAVTSNPLPAAAACVGAVLPDKIEGTPGSVGWNTWRSRHRGWSHWPMLYLALLGALTQRSSPLSPGCSSAHCATSQRTPSAGRFRLFSPRRRSASASSPSARSVNICLCCFALLLYMHRSISSVHTTKFCIQKAPLWEIVPITALLIGLSDLPSRRSRSHPRRSADGTRRGGRYRSQSPPAQYPRSRPL